MEAPKPMNGARVIAFNNRGDSRGWLGVLEVGDGLPFIAKRVFMISTEFRNASRGCYANRKQSEFMICVRGSANIGTEDRFGEHGFVLSNSHCGLYVPPMTWVNVEMSQHCEVLVLASDVFNPADHVFTMSEFHEAHATA